MKILFVYTQEKVKHETLQTIMAMEDAGHEVRRREATGLYSYWNAMKMMFSEGDTFLNIEHDVVLSLDQVNDLAACPEPVCAVAYPYAGPDWSWEPREIQALGVCKFSAELVKDMAPKLTNEQVEFRAVDPAIFHLLPGYPQHIFHRHYPNAEHIQ